MKKYPNATDVVWCQDEPQNQGAWFFVQHQIHENMLEGQKLGYAGRPPRPRRPWATPTCTRSSRRRCSTRPSAKLKGFVSRNESAPLAWRALRAATLAMPDTARPRRETGYQKELSWQSLK